MTPAINLLLSAKTPHQLHEYDHEPACQAYGEEASDKLGVAQARVFKTLVVSLDAKTLAVAVIPVSAQLSMKQAAKAFGAKKAAMAAKAEVERSSGYVLGGVSPLAQRKRLPTCVDNSALDYDTIYISGGRRGLEIELRGDDLAALTQGSFAHLCQD